MKHATLLDLIEREANFVNPQLRQETDHQHLQKLLRDLTNHYPDLWHVIDNMRRDKGIGLKDWHKSCYLPIFLIIISLDISATEIKDYIARYSFESPEISLNGIRKLTSLDQGYELSFEAKNWVAKMQFNSNFIVSDDQVIPKGYKVKIKPKVVVETRR